MSFRNNMFKENEQELDSRATYSSPEEATLSSIAHELGLDLTSLEDRNPHLKNKTIPRDTDIDIHEVKMAASNKIAGPGEHIVKIGESIYSIAKMYGVDVEALKKHNNLGGGLVLGGDVIKIPPSLQVAPACGMKKK